MAQTNTLVNFRLDPAGQKLLRLEAARRGVSLSALIRSALFEHLRRETAGGGNGSERDEALASRASASPQVSSPDPAMSERKTSAS